MRNKHLDRMASDIRISQGILDDHEYAEVQKVSLVVQQLAWMMGSVEDYLSDKRKILEEDSYGTEDNLELLKSKLAQLTDLVIDLSK